MSNELGLGRVIKPDEKRFRDAIHVAVMPVIADETISRGNEVGFVFGSTERVKGKPRVYGLNPVGIVDPFLDDYSVQKGEKFWMFLFPGTEWEHPCLTPQETGTMTDEAKWLRKFADKWNFNYDEMIAGAQEDDGFITAMGRDLHSADELDDGDEAFFWHNIELLTGKKFGKEHRENFGWSCSC